MKNTIIEVGWRGQPVIAGTDVTVACILERFSQDDSIEKICSDYRLTKDQVHAALSYAETNLPQHILGELLYPIWNEGSADDELDYSLLTACMF
jgi:uncharacterized protein (DUF433 family)